MKNLKIPAALAGLLAAALLVAPPAEASARGGARFLELNLNNTSLQNVAFGSTAGRTNLDILRVIDRAGRDSGIAGLVLNLSGFSAGHATMWELRHALQEFRATGKPVVAFVSTADLNLYYLASVADRIVMDGQGSLWLLGYVWGRGYAAGALERLGVGVRELRHFEYKSAAETFTRGSLSDADRRQFGEWLDDAMAVTRDAITEARSWTPAEFDSILDEEFLFSAAGALERGIVDSVGRRQAVIDAAVELTGGSEPSFVLFGDSGTSISGSRQAYAHGGGRGGRRTPVIAVINANGITDMERGMSARTLARTIGEVSRAGRVAAIVLRINSPGGSAEAADHIAEAVAQARLRVPVVVSMGGVAASGGYWAGVTANHVLASPVTVTGSIGVIATWFYDSGLNDRLGLSVDMLQRGARADMMSGMILPHRDLDETEQARFRRYIIDHYDVFVATVAANRGMEIEEVEAVAQGRVFSGQGALDAGLIDGIGGLWHAVRIARELAGIPDGQGVAFAQFPRPTFTDILMARLSRMGMFGGRQSAPSLAAQTAQFASEMFMTADFIEDARFRIANNGRAMPILPMDGGSR